MNTFGAYFGRWYLLKILGVGGSINFIRAARVIGREELRNLVEGRVRVAEICRRFDDICRLIMFLISLRQGSEEPFYGRSLWF